MLARGYIDADDHEALRHTVGGIKPRSLGLYLDIDYANDYLRQIFLDVKAKDAHPVHDVAWLLNDLRTALLTKHKETFRVKARHNDNRESEKFHYVEVEHTTNPFIDKLETLFETGLITMDYTLHIKL